MNGKLYCAVFDSSSEDEELEEEYSYAKKPKLDFFDNNDDDDEVLQILKLIERYDRAKNENYVEQTVRSYMDDTFIRHFRMKRTVVDRLIERFEKSEIFQRLNSHKAGKKVKSSLVHILVFLWYVGHTDTYLEVSDRFHITDSTLFAIITRVSDFLLTFAPNVIKLPTEAEKACTEAHYLTTKKFPRVIGSIDGTHVEINRPNYDSQSYYNRKKRFSIQVQGLVNHKKKFLDVFVGYPGSVHDARVFRCSDLFNELPGLCTDNRFILADSAYPLMRQVIVPFRDNGHLTPQKRYFNTKLSSCRITVEHTFGELKQRFRKLYKCELRKIERIVTLIYACCVLHNLSDDDDLALFDAPEVENLPDELPLVGANNDDDDDHRDNDNNDDNMQEYRNTVVNEVLQLRIANA